MRIVLAFLVGLLIILNASSALVVAQDKPPSFADDAALLKALESRLNRFVAAPGDGVHNHAEVTQDGRWVFYSSTEKHTLVPTELGRKSIEMENVEGSAALLIAAAPDASWLALKLDDRESRNVKLSLWRIDESAGKAVKFASYALDGWLINSAALDSTRFLISTRASRAAPLKCTVLVVDANAATLVTKEVQIPAGQYLTSTRFRQRPVLETVAERNYSYRLASLDETDGQFRLVAGDEIANLSTRGRTLVLSPDGKRCHVDCYPTSVIFEPGPTAKLLGIASRCVGSEFTPNSQQLVVADSAGTVCVFDSATPNEQGKPISQVLPPVKGVDVFFLDPLGEHAVVLDNHYNMIFVPLAMREAFHATVCGQPFTWERPAATPEKMKWPALQLSHSFIYGAAGRHSLEYEIRNIGTVSAYMVEVQLAVQWDAEAAAALHRGMFGTLAPGESRRRNLMLSDDVLKNKGARLTLRVVEAFEFVPPPQSWLYLPRRTHTDDAYDIAASAVFERGVECVKELRDIPGYAPKLVATAAPGFRFAGRETATIWYQTPYRLDAEGARINRDVMQVTDNEEFMRHGEMFLYWFIPHELSHTLDTAGSWKGEHHANSLQPFLTALILARLSDAPYSAWFMSQVYARYEQVLGAFSTPDDERRIRSYLDSAGEKAPYDSGAFTYFESNARNYVYVGVRVSRAAQAKYSTAQEVLDNVFK